MDSVMQIDGPQGLVNMGQEQVDTYGCGQVRECKSQSSDMDAESLSVATATTHSLNR